MEPMRNMLSFQAQHALSIKFKIDILPMLREIYSSGIGLIMSLSHND